MSGGVGGFEVDVADPNRIAVLEEALDALPANDSALRSALLARLSIVLSFTGAEHRRGQLADHAVAMARRLDDPRALATALAARCDALAGPDHVGSRSAAATEIIECARLVHDRTIELLGHRLRFLALAEGGNWADVDDEIRSYAAVSEPTGQPVLNWYLPLWRGTRAQMRGDGPGADAQAAELRRLVAASGSTNAKMLEGNQRVLREIMAGHPAEVVSLIRQLFAESPDLMTGTQLAISTRQADRPANAAALLKELMADVPGLSSVNHPTWPLLLALAGETDEAARRLQDCLETLGHRVRDSEWLPEVVQAATTAIVLRHRDAAAKIFPILSPYGDLFAIEGIGAATWGCVHGYLGRLAVVLGRTVDAEVHLAAAVRLDSAAGAALAQQTRQWLADLRDEAAIPASVLPAPTPAQAGPVIDGAFRWEGEVWRIEFAGRAARLRDSKGIRDIAVLLAEPGRDIAVQELTQSARDGDSQVMDLADQTAIAAYRRRLIDLEEECSDAQVMHDLARAERAESERDALITQLAAVTGLGGRARQAGSASERMRKAVGNRIRETLRRIEQVHPELARHLRVSIRTGTFCRYEPDHETRWDVRRPGVQNPRL